MSSYQLDGKKVDIGHCSQHHLVCNHKTPEHKIQGLCPSLAVPFAPSPVPLNVSLSGVPFPTSPFMWPAYSWEIYAREHCRRQSWPVQIKKRHMPPEKKVWDRPRNVEWWERKPASLQEKFGYVPYAYTHPKGDKNLKEGTRWLCHTCNCQGSW